MSWATDGSMTPAASGLGNSKSITAAVTRPTTLVLCITHQNASILQGEQMGLVSALVLADSSPQIYTDHLNSTTLIDDSCSVINQENRLRMMNGRSYYRWILDLTLRKSASISYTKAHTSDTSLQASLNREADHFASLSQKIITTIPIAPIPTFFMNPYTFHHESNGWIESNTHYFIDHFMAKTTADNLSLLHKHQLTTWLYDPNPPPSWIYTKASSAYTALVQLYACSGQLATADGLCQKKVLTSRACRFGCPVTEDPHHIFASCPRYSELQSKELATLTSNFQTRLDDVSLISSDQSPLLLLAKSLFSDSKTIWPLYSTTFYLGHIPKIRPLVPPLSN